MRFWRGYVVVAVLLAFGGCDADKKRDRGPNPYRRELRVPNSPNTLREPSDDALASPASRPTTAPDPALTFDRRTVGPSVLFVNQDAISVEDVLLPIRADAKRARDRLPPERFLPWLAQLVRAQIDHQVSTIVVYHEAKKTMTEKDEEPYLKQADLQIQELVNLQFGGLHAKFERHLMERGLTVAAFREKTKQHLVVQRYLAERFRPLAEHPKRDELLKYYQAHAAEFTTPARATLSLIEKRFDTALKSPRRSATPGELEAAKRLAFERIHRAKAELASGVPFAAVAKAYSEDARKDAGGHWGEIGPETLRERYKPATDALFKMKPGEVSDVIEGPDAYFIVRCEATQPEQRLSFEEAQPAIVERILDEKYGHLQRQYVTALLAKANVSDEQEFFRSVMVAALDRFGPSATEAAAPRDSSRQQTSQ